MWCWGAGGKENGATRGCLVNAELVNYLWKNTIVMRDSTGAMTKLHETGKQTLQFYLNLRKKVDGLNATLQQPYLGLKPYEDATRSGVCASCWAALAGSIIAGRDHKKARQTNHFSPEQIRAFSSGGYLRAGNSYTISVDWGLLLCGIGLLKKLDRLRSASAAHGYTRGMSGRRRQSGSTAGTTAAT